jgi:ribonuclease D
MNEKDTEFIYVDTPELLRKAAEEWKTVKDAGIDLECENNLHHHGVYASLIQISTDKNNWIIDAITLKDIKQVVDMLENPDIQKIFHDVSFDFRILYSQFHCAPKNVFDTQMAVLLLGRKEMGLASLLKEFFDMKKEEKFQMADWKRRPLTREMLQYAIKDATHLIRLRDILKDELEKKSRLGWTEQEMKHLEEREWLSAEPTYEDFTGYRLMTDKERATLKRLFILREKLAERVDRPVHFIINNRMLSQLVREPLTKLDDWLNMRGVHPIVKNRAKEFLDAVMKAKNEEISIPRIERKRYSTQQRKKAEMLNDLKEELGQRYGISGHLILNKDQAQEIVLKGTMDTMRPWQREIVEAELAKSEKKQ